MGHLTDHLLALFNLQPNSQALISLARQSSMTKAPSGSRLFASGDVCESFVLIASGCARVQLSTKTGRDITLYRLEPGQSCALTTSCLLSETPYYAEGIAETDLELITIPSAVFRDAAHRSPEIMQFLISDFASRIAGLTALIDRLTSRDINHDLAVLLLARADGENVVALSHKAIADELGTAREVVSRRLKDWEKLSLVELKRGSLRLVDQARIKTYAD